MRTATVCGLTFAAVIIFCCSLASAQGGGYGNLPLSFEQNKGQTGKKVLFLSRGSGYNLFLTPTEAVLSLQKPVTEGSVSLRPARPERHPKTDNRQTSIVRLQMLGANSHPQTEGQDALPGVANYCIGNDPGKWRTNVTTYRKVAYKSVYPGIDLVFYGNQRQLEYDWRVGSHALVNRIRWSIIGAHKVSLTPSGDLRLQTASGDVIEHAPLAYQEGGGQRKRISARFVLASVYNSRPRMHNRTLGFKVASYDHARPLVIDPVLVYSTYLGGSSGIPSFYGDISNGIAVDSVGNTYVTGYTHSADFPTQNALQPTIHRYTNVFVSKINAAGTALVYSTYLGGYGLSGDSGTAIAVDGAGSAYVTGNTSADNFPLQNPLQPSNHAHGGTTVFVARIGSYNWQGTDITVGSDNKARLLWHYQDGSSITWSVDNSGVFSVGPVLRPYAGYAVQAIAAGQDGYTRLLWNKGNQVSNTLNILIVPGSTAALWFLDANNNFIISFSYGPFDGWSASDITVASDTFTRILWTNANGQIEVWTIDGAGAPHYGYVYGPYAGDTARRIAAGADGYTRVLWNKNDGSAALWFMDTSNAYVTSVGYGPFPGWSAIDIAVGSDNQTRILWTNANGQMVVWSVNDNGSYTISPVYGPYIGWTATKIAAGVDGLSRVLWFNADGTQVIWLLNSDNTYNTSLGFGPY